MAGLTVFAIGTGLITQILAVDTGSQELTVAYNQGPTEDFLLQGSSIQSSVKTSPFAPDVRIIRHKVVAGDTLPSISKKYSISKDTIRWANSKLFLPFSDKVQPGWDLRIPEMNGVLHRVIAGENVEGLAKRYQGHRLDIIEVNNLQGPKYKLTAGKEIFIPNGEVPPPPPDMPYIPPIQVIPGKFISPLIHSRCRGYIQTRGFSGYHHGVDLSVGGGCPVNAVASGKVVFAGMDPNWYAGYHVVIDHGGGVVSEYWHGKPNSIWVRKGEFVDQGQALMQMWDSGNSYGIHLHFIVKKNGVAVNPYGIVPY